MAGRGLPCFGPVPQPGDALYVGLSDPVPRCAVALRFKCRIEGVGVDPRRPAPSSGRHTTAAVGPAVKSNIDETGGLNRAGDVVVHVPSSHVASVVDQERAGWLRAVVTKALDGQPSYSSSPQIDGLEAFTTGGTATRLTPERSNGRPR